VERRLGRTVLKTYRAVLDLDDLVPNNQQPRLGPKEDVELQRQIEANEGIFEPLLVEPEPDLPGKYRIVDGDRRWTNSKVLVETQKKDQYRRVPVEITERTLTEDERLRVWVYIHRQRKEWDAKEKEMVAYRLVDMVGRASAANILGTTVREVDKLVEIYELSEKLTGIREPGASITWAREIKNLNKNFLSPDVMDTLIKSVNERQMTNSKDTRKLRKVLKDPVARQEFLESGSVDAALLKVAPPPDPKPEGLLGDIEELSVALQRYSWTALAALKGDAKAIHKIEQAEALLKQLKQQIVE
jgi:ParB family transcriptional regulator, chromosome partitioning protein